MKIIAIIPARYESKRFPGKALALIGGIPMIGRVYQQARKSQLIENVYIATDNNNIRSSIEDLGGQAIMTSDKCRSGTDRVAEAAASLGLNDDDIVINIQGDQPLLPPECLEELVQPFFTNKGLAMATLAHVLDSEEAINDPNNVKVIMDRDGFAIYFSRAVIPYNRDRKQGVQYYKHIGIYAYSCLFLRKYSSLPPSPLENIEKLEQLRALYNGHQIAVSITDYDSPSVDSAADLLKVTSMIK